MNIYLEAEKSLAEGLGWFGIVQRGEDLIGYPGISNPKKVFRSVVPKYCRDSDENSLLAQVYGCIPVPGESCAAGDIYVVHYKDHSSPEQAKMYLVVLEVLEKMDDVSMGYEG